MGSRKIDLPPNFDMLPEDLQDAAMETACMWSLKVAHGHGQDSPLLVSREKIK